MQRRTFLRHAAALTALGAAPLRAARGPAPRIGVIGGGIVGSSIAWHLASAGARVTLFEKAQPASGATRNSFAWLNAFVDDPAYRELRLASLADWHTLDRSLRLGILWGGYASWASAPADLKLLRESIAQMRSSRFPVKPIGTAQLQALAPGIITGEVQEAFYSSADGHLDPVAVTQRFVSEARRLGAQVRLDTEVIGLDLASGELRGVQTPAGPVSLDRVVIASGVDTPRLTGMAGFALRLKHQPGILAHSVPVKRLTRAIFDAPGTLSIKQMADGSIVGTDSPHPPDIPAHREILDHAVPFPSAELAAMHGNRILGKIGAVLPGARGLALERLTLGFRPMPIDELPVVGLVPGMSDVYVAVTHSGVTLAPILGRHVTHEILRSERVAALAPFRPERFQEKT